MKNNNINSGAEVVGFDDPTDEEFEFKELKYSRSNCFGDRTIGVSEVDENGYIYIDCIKGEKQIRASIGIEDKKHSSYLAISIQGKNVSDKKVAKIGAKIKGIQREGKNKPDLAITLHKVLDVIITSMKEIDL